jgi:hypothetical protein
MNLPPDDNKPKAPAAVPRSWLRASVVAMLAIVFVTAAVGFPMRWNCWPMATASGC